MVLVGPSGCGKSTLLRMIAGLEEVTAGSVAIGGRDVTDLAPRHRDIAMVFQSYALYPHMTVRQNLGYGLKVRRTQKAEIAAARRRGRRPARARAAARPAACAAVGRSAPARRDGSRDRARAAGLPDGRAAVEPRREAPRRHARVAGPAARPARRDNRLRHARPDGGDDAGSARRRDAGRARRAGDEPQTLYREPVDLFVAAFIGSPAMNLVEAAIDGDHAVFGRAPRPARPGPASGARGRARRARHPAGGLRGGVVRRGAPAANRGPRRGGRGARRGRARLLHGRRRAAWPPRYASARPRPKAFSPAEPTLFTARVDPGATRARRRDRQPHRRPRALPLLRRGQRGEPRRRRRVAHRAATGRRDDLIHRVVLTTR